jgi:hypothetical protein
VIALVFVLAGIGAVIFFAANSGFAGNSPFDRNNIAFIVEESKTIKVDAKEPVTLSVDDAAGDVVVTGGDVDKVEVKIIKTAYDSTQARAEEEVKTIEYSIEQNGNNITLKYELAKSMNFNNNINTVDFIVTVPTETMVEVDNSFGIVDVRDVKGDVDINGDFGDISAENIEGALVIESSSGKINVKSINAGDNDLNVDADFGDITLEKVSGRNITVTSNSGAITFTDVRAVGIVFMKSDFGNTSYENGSAESLSLEANSGKTSVTKVNIRKELKVDNDFGNIELTQALAGSYNLHTNSGEITVDGAKGNLKAYTDFGNINIQNAKSVNLDIKTNSGTIDFSGTLGDGPHNVKSDFGNITLALPSDAKLNVDLSTDFGNISSDIPITVTLSGDLEDDQQTGEMNGGGGLLTAQTNSGNISITAIK